MLNEPTRGGPQRVFEPSPTSVSAARRFVASAVRDLTVDQDAAVLLTSELATNAVKYANREYRIQVHRCEDAVRVEVINDAPELLLMVKEPDETGGRGLHILEALAQAWGVDHRPGAKAIWFELPIVR